MKLQFKIFYRRFFFIAVIFSNISFGGITDNWYPLPAASTSYAFLNNHSKYARMLWAFDYGHALIYEQLWRNAQIGDYDFSVIEGPMPEPQQSILDQVMTILNNPPTQSPMEETLSPLFTKDFNWVMDMFAWTHKLHWVSADVISAEQPLEKAQAIMKQQLSEAYQRFPTIALPTQCKSMMQLMEGQPYSMQFRRKAPQANGLIWAYHYYQLAIYEPLMLPPGPDREAGLAKVLKNFRKMQADPANAVSEMPMSKTVAPNFTKAFPELAAIFDNLHEFHDVVGDILSITGPLTLNAEDEMVKLAVPDSIKIKLPKVNPNDPTEKQKVLIKYDKPEVKKAQMDFILGLTLDKITFLIDCAKNGHT